MTPYPDVVEAARRVTECPELRGRSSLVVDATGVGSPVVDLLRRGSVEVHDCAGDDYGRRRGVVGRVGVACAEARFDGGLQVAFQKRWLQVARGCAESGAFRKELLGMRSSVSETGHERYGGRGHDDLVMAAALARWRVRRCWAGAEERGRLV